nr:TrwA: DNA binding accessory protein [uncultured bacterium]
MEKRALYEAQAMAAELPLSTYLRNRLEREDAVLDELQMLRRAVERMADRAPGETKGGDGLQGMGGVMLEMLLTLRQLAGAKNDLAQKEIARLGYDVWSSNK